MQWRLLEIQAEYGAIPAYADIVRRNNARTSTPLSGRIASTRQMVQVADLAAHELMPNAIQLVVAAVEIRWRQVDSGQCPYSRKMH